MITKAKHNVLGIFILLSLCLLYNKGKAQSNEGRVFWFGFMEHIDVGNNTMVAMLTSKTNTNGRISAPALGFSRTFDIQPGEVTLINLPAAAEVIGSENITNQGLLVEANDPISLYIHQYANFRSEASLVLPSTSIGREYYVMSYPGINFDNFGNNYSEFLVVATQDNTQIELQLSDATLGGRASGEVISLTLDRGQTYQVQANSANGDLTGTYITSDKNIAVFGGSEWSQVPRGCTFMDNLLEQMYPVSTWGLKYITIPSINVNSDVYRIIASQDGTMINLITDNNERIFNLDAGEFVEYSLTGETSEITSNQPIMVAQYNVGSNCTGHVNGDPSMLLLNPVEQSRDTVTLYNSSFQNIFENYISAIVKTDDIPITTFDGNPIQDAATLSGTIGDSTFSYFIMSVSTGSHTLISPGCGVIASAYGYGDAESYAYGGGANFKSSRNNPLPDGGCLNDTVIFDSGLSPFRYDVAWDFGDGNTAVGVEVSHVYIQLDTFLATMTFTDKCLEVTDSRSKPLIITLRDMVDAPASINICEYEDLMLSATDIENANYQWTGPNNFQSQDQFVTIDSILSTAQGNYEVIGIVSGCATFPAQTEVIVYPAPIPILPNDTATCFRKNNITLDPGDFPSYQWSDGSTSRSIEITEEGFYAVTVTDDMLCSGEALTFVDGVCPSEVFAPNIFTPNGDGQNDLFTIYTQDVESYTISIYDRWGNLVHRGNEASEPWDGSFIGNPANQAVYTYYIEYQGMDAKGNTGTFIYTGDVTLVR